MRLRRQQGQSGAGNRTKNNERSFCASSANLFTFVFRPQGGIDAVPIPGPEKVPYATLAPRTHQARPIELVSARYRRKPAEAVLELVQHAALCAHAIRGTACNSGRTSAF